MDEELLERLRNQIDETDKEILYMLKRRIQIVRKIAKFKIENNLEVFQPDREAILFNKLGSQAITLKLDENFVQDLYELIVNESKKAQEEIIAKKQAQ